MRKGFTLMELIIVVIIIGILAAIGIPQFFKIAERGRASEAIVHLGALRNAQIRYAAEHGHTTDVLGDLDVDYMGMLYFNVPALTKQDAIQDPANRNVTIVDIDRNNTNNAGYGNYTLEIQVDGDILCTDDVQPICATLGY